MTCYKSAAYLIDAAGKAVDGNRNSDYYAGSCSHTTHINPSPPVWWMVDLEQDVTITNVIITSRNEGGM